MGLDLLQVLAISVFSIVVLFLLAKLLGNRQMSQLSMFDYVTGISIGSIAAEMATNIEGDWMYPLLAMVVYAFATLCISILNSKSRRLRSLFLGKALVLYDRGVLFYDNLRKGKMDLSEFLTQCRNSGFFNLSQLSMAVLETNGRISFLPEESARPVTPADLQLSPTQSRPPYTVIMDGLVMASNLKASGNNEIWLEKQLTLQGYDTPGDVLLATVDTDNNLSVYRREMGKTSLNHFT